MQGNKTREWNYTYRMSQKKILLGVDLYLKDNNKFSSSILNDIILSISVVILDTEPFFADI